jgi:hypothetical protein
LVKAEAAHVKTFPPALRESLFRPACAWLEANDRRGEALLFLLREADPSALQERLAKRGQELRKKSRFAEALHYFRHIARDPACAPPLRMELAACGLRVSGHDLNPEARAADLALQQFTRLLPGYEAEILDFLKKAKWLQPEDLYYLGFHFADKDGPLRKFGGLVLKLLVQRSPRAKITQDAKRKLRSEGLS